jgi:hypothetical protein
VSRRVSGSPFCFAISLQFVRINGYSHQHQKGAQPTVGKGVSWLLLDEKNAQTIDSKDYRHKSLIKAYEG